jgi:dihydrofolate reductase
MDMSLIQLLKPQWQFKMYISHLVALSNNSVIGVNNDLPWTLKKDLKHFSSYTQNKAIVMGRKTFESIGRPLPNRQNIVISSSMPPQEGVEVVRSLEEGIAAAEHWNKKNELDDEVVLIGGGHVFEESILIVNKLVLTRVDCEITGDIFYPAINLADWIKISDESHAKDADNEYNFKIETYLKN